MKINKQFWYKENGNSKQAYSYDNPAYPKKFSQQYGGDVLDYLMVNENISAVVDVETEIYSVLMNGSAEEKQTSSPASDPRRFKVLVEGPEGFKEYDNGHEHLRDANNVAKTITKYYKTVLVVRKRFVDREIKGASM